MKPSDTDIQELERLLKLFYDGNTTARQEERLYALAAEAEGETMPRSEEHTSELQSQR